MNADAITIDTRDVEKMIRMLNRLDRSPQKAVNKGTSKAVLMLKRQVRSKAPVKSGTLRANIVVKAESNRRVKGKKVREVTFKGGEEANAKLQKPIRNPGQLGGGDPKAYYPASQEFGFLARAKDGSGGVVYYDAKAADFRTRNDRTPGKVSTVKVEGRHFMRDAADSSSPQVKETMINTTMEELEKIWTSDS